MKDLESMAGDITYLIIDRIEEAQVDRHGFPTLTPLNGFCFEGPAYTNLRIHLPEGERFTLPYGMINLTTLLCDNNPLDDLPEDIKDIGVLICKHCQLSYIPMDINPTVLECSGNQLSYLPSNMTRLQVLDSDFTALLGEGNQAQVYHRLREEDNLPCYRAKSARSVLR